MHRADCQRLDVVGDAGKVVVCHGGKDSLACRPVLHTQRVRIVQRYYDPLGGEAHGDRGAYADFALQVERAAVQFDEGLGQRQTETGALVLAVQVTVDLAETRERLVMCRAECLLDLRYKDVRNLGSFQAWVDAGGDVDK